MVAAHRRFYTGAGFEDQGRAADVSRDGGRIAEGGVEKERILRGWGRAFGARPVGKWGDPAVADSDTVV